MDKLISVSADDPLDAVALSPPPSGLAAWGSSSLPRGAVGSSAADSNSFGLLDARSGGGKSAGRLRESSHGEPPAASAVGVAWPPFAAPCDGTWSSCGTNAAIAPPAAAEHTAAGRIVAVLRFWLDDLVDLVSRISCRSFGLAPRGGRPRIKWLLSEGWIGVSFQVPQSSSISIVLVSRGRPKHAPVTQGPAARRARWVRVCLGHVLGVARPFGPDTIQAAKLQ